MAEEQSFFRQCHRKSGGELSMTFEATASANISFGSVPTRGASDAARFVAEQVSDDWDHLQNSYSLGLAAKGAYDELFDSCGVP
jgi:TnpA family transposase